MHLKKTVAICMIILTGVLHACSTTTPASKSLVGLEDTQSNLITTYRELVKSGGTVFTLDPQQSQVHILVFRAGRLANLGHNHVLSAPKFSGFFYMPSANPSDARFDLEFRLDELELDNPTMRAKLGPGFASAMSPQAISATRDNMLGQANLQAEQFPRVQIRSLQIVGATPKFAVQLQINLHGQTREMWVPIQVNELSKRLVASGAFVLRQTDFAIQPFSALGSLLAVQDEIIVEFEIVGVGLS